MGNFINDIVRLLSDLTLKQKVVVICREEQECSFRSVLAMHVELGEMPLHSRRDGSSALVNLKGHKEEHISKPDTDAMSRGKTNLV